MFLELHHVGDYTIFPHSIIMNYLTFIKAAWHKNQRKFDFCICTKSKIVLYIRVQYKIKNHIVRPSAVQNQKSYCTSECSTKIKNRTVRPSAVQNKKSYCTSECSKNQKSYYTSKYSIKSKSYCTSECSIKSKIILYVRV